MLGPSRDELAHLIEHRFGLRRNVLAGKHIVSEGLCVVGAKLAHFIREPGHVRIVCQIQRWENVQQFLDVLHKGITEGRSAGLRRIVSAEPLGHCRHYRFNPLPNVGHRGLHGRV